jgi:hypothetical protein
MDIAVSEKRKEKRKRKMLTAVSEKRKKQKKKCNLQSCGSSECWILAIVTHSSF